VLQEGGFSELVLSRMMTIQFRKFSCLYTIASGITGISGGFQKKRGNSTNVNTWQMKARRNGLIFNLNKFLNKLTNFETIAIKIH